jgi:N-acetylmuramoyl-L-alanine amidase
MHGRFIILILLPLLFFCRLQAQLEVGVSQVSNERCRTIIKGFNSVNVSQTLVNIKFYSDSYPIIFNNCDFITIDKKKRDIIIFGGNVVSSIGCDSGRTTCNISFKKSKSGTIDSAYPLPFEFEAEESSPLVQTAEKTQNFKMNKKGKTPLIVIDAGHGGSDPGAIGRNGTREKDVTLRYAKYTAKILKDSGFKVYLTRDSDEFLKLYERIDIAMIKNADFFISIHADSARNIKARGATIYTLAPHAVDKATRKAEIRTHVGGNFVSSSEDEDLIFNILNIQHNSNVRQSFKFSQHLVSSMKEKGIRLTSIPIRSADFAVLKAPTFPAILLEIGYLSNAEDENMINSREYMEKVANSIKNAIKER